MLSPKVSYPVWTPALAQPSTVADGFFVALLPVSFFTTKSTFSLTQLHIRPLPSEPNNFTIWFFPVYPFPCNIIPSHRSVWFFSLFLLETHVPWCSFLNQPRNTSQDASLVSMSLAESLTTWWRRLRALLWGLSLWLWCRLRNFLWSLSLWLVVGEARSSRFKYIGAAFQLHDRAW